MTTTPMTDAATRDAARAQLDLDDRLEFGTQMQHLLNAALTELQQIVADAAELDGDLAPAAVTSLVARLGRNKQYAREAARLDKLLSDALDQAVRLARAHGLSWRLVGKALGEDGRNTANRYPAIR
jgi:hypothetical protein